MCSACVQCTPAVGNYETGCMVISRLHSVFHKTLSFHVGAFAALYLLRYENKKMSWPPSDGKLLVGYYEK